MLVEVFRSEERMVILKKQADQTTKEYMKLLDTGSGVAGEICIVLIHSLYLLLSRVERKVDCC